MMRQWMEKLRARDERLLRIRSIPWITLGLTVLAWIAYETYAVITGEPTISQMVWTASENYPPLMALVGLGIGLLFAHFFWPKTENKTKR